MLKESYCILLDYDVEVLELATERPEVISGPHCRWLSATFLERARGPLPYSAGTHRLWPRPFSRSGRSLGRGVDELHA